MQATMNSSAMGTTLARTPRVARPPAPRRGVSRQHAFVTIAFLIVCALDCAAASALPAAVVHRVIGPALVGAWMVTLIAAGWMRWHAGTR